MAGGGGAGLVGDPHHQRRPAAVDHGVGELRRDDLAPQPVLLQRVGKFLARSASGNSGRARGRDRDRPARWNRAGRRRARAWRRPAAPTAPAASAAAGARTRSAISMSSGRNSTARSSSPRCSSVCISRCWKPRSSRPRRSRQRQRQRLQVVVAQHQRRDLVGHLAEQRVARLRCVSRPSRTGRLSAILMLTSTSEVLTPAELSMASVLSRTPLPRRLDAAALGHAEVGALADHLGADVARR